MDNNSPSDQDRLFLRQLSATVSRDVAARDVVAPIIAPTLIAGWLDRTLSETESAEIEDALLRDTDLLEDLLAITRDREPPAEADRALVARLCRLVEPAATSANVIAMPIPPRNRLRRSAVVWLSWGAVAASVAIVSLVGFDLGSIVGKTEISQTTSDTALVSNDDLD